MTMSRWMKQGTQSLCSGTTQRDGTGREVEGGFRMGGHLCTRGWFMLMYGKNHHDLWSNYPPIKISKLIKKLKSDIFFCIWMTFYQGEEKLEQVTGKESEPRLHYNQTNINDISQMNLNINRKDRCFNVISNRTGKLIISLRKPLIFWAISTSNNWFIGSLTAPHQITIII